MGTSNFKTFPPLWQRHLSPIVFSILLAGGLLYWFTSGPSQEERQRESVCKNWGYEDEKSLARCRKSQSDVDAVIAPNFRRARLKSIGDFNRELSGWSQNRTTTNEADYAPAELKEIAMAVGGVFGSSRKNETALEGQKFKIAGRIVTQTPDQSDHGPFKTWEPQSYELWGPMPKAKNVMPEIVRLDIESLNRDGRQFIQNHCEIVGFTRCDAVIYGHVGTVTEEKVLHIRYRGIIADEIQISPLNPNAPAP